MGKNSFTLVETIISLTFLAIAVSIVYKLAYSNSFHRQFELLNSYENSFAKNSYNNSFSKSQVKITISKDSIQQILEVNKIQTTDENIRLFKYELSK